MNTMREKAADEGIIAENFLKNGFKQEQFATITTPNGGQKINILVGSVRWPANQPGELLPGQPAVNADSYNPFPLRFHNPTNNPNGFDLWIDIIVDKKTNRFATGTINTLTP